MTTVLLAKTLRGGYDAIQTRRVLLFPDIAGGLALDEEFRIVPAGSGGNTYKCAVHVELTEATKAAWTEYAAAQLVLEEARQRFETAERAFRNSEAAREIRSLLRPQPRSLPPYEVFPETDMHALRAFVESVLGGDISQQHIQTSGYDCGTLRYSLRKPIPVNVATLRNFRHGVYTIITPCLVVAPTETFEISEISFAKRGYEIPPYAQADWEEFNGRR